jgi:hypothetical protein
MSDKLTDLEICRRIAKIEGFKTCAHEGYEICTYTGEKPKNFLGFHFIPYNPLENDALCFRLMVKYNVSFWQNEDKGMFCAKVRDPEFGVVRVKKPNVAICLAIIESKVKSND